MAPSAEFPRRGSFIGSVNLTEVAPARAAGAARATSAGKRFIHDPSDGARAPSTLGAAAEAAIDLAGGTRRLAGSDHRADVVIAQYVAGADDHGNPAFPTLFSTLCNYRYRSEPVDAKAKHTIYTYSNLSQFPGGMPGSAFEILKYLQFVNQQQRRGELRPSWSAPRRSRRRPPPPAPCRRPRP
jgi:hypothetical protein